MLRTTGGTRGGSFPCRVQAAFSGLKLRSIGGKASRNVPCRVNDAPGGSVCRVSGTFGGLVLRCVGGMLCAVLVASGCSDDGSNAVESVTTTFPSTTAVPITTSTPATVPAATTVTPPTSLPAANAAPIPTGAPLSEEQQVFSAIERYYEVLVEANDPPDPDSPLWDQVAAPEFADRLKAIARGSLEDRIAVRWAEDRQPWVKSPSVVWKQGSLVVVDLCLRNNGVLYDLDTGEIIDDSIGYYWRQVTVSNRSGNWLISENRLVQKFEAQETCIASYQ